MDFFFKPQGIAVIGATPNPFKGGNAILKTSSPVSAAGSIPSIPATARSRDCPVIPR